MRSMGLAMMRAVAVLAIVSLLPWGRATVAAAGSDRIALVMGLSAYRSITTLDNTVNDARDMAATLERIGFDVTLSLDTTGEEMRRLLEDFAFRSEVAELALIYFAGHGVEVQGENFMIPVDADIHSNRDVQRQSVSLKQLLKTVEQARKMRIVILDSCRNNPLGDLIDAAGTATAETGGATDGARGVGGGLAPVNPDRGTLVAFAARDGQVALDGTGRNSPFARALMEKMVIPGLEISLMFRQVRDRVLQETANLQEPHTYGSLTGVPFYLAGPAPGGPELSDRPIEEAWASLRPEQEVQLTQLADHGDTRSMLGLAYMRLDTKQGRYDPAGAAAYLERAAAAGSPEAQFKLAKLYEQGLGVPKDEKRALELFRASAAQDFPDAVNDLGFLHYYGRLGLTPDPQKALELFERAADLRHPQAQFNFAALIDDGVVPGKGPKDAAQYLYRALRSGSSDVLDLLTERPTMFTVATRRALQEVLGQYGFYDGAIDGAFGPATRRGVRRAFGLSG